MAITLQKQLLEQAGGSRKLITCGVTAANGNELILALDAKSVIRVVGLIQTSTAAATGKFVSSADGAAVDFSSSKIPLTAQIECDVIFETKKGSALYFDTDTDCEFGLLVEIVRDMTA